MRTTIERHGIGRYVQMLGRREDVATLLLASDVLLLLSPVEGCPNALMEAQYLGVPVVSTASGGTCDTVLHGETGYLAGVHDGDQLAACLVELLTNDDRRQLFSAAGREF